MSKKKILVFGSLNADLTIYCEKLPQPGETIHGSDFGVKPGGKIANQAVAAARLGGQVTLIGAVGDDANGRMLQDSVQAAGADISQLRTVTEPTGVAVISVDSHGENSIIISAGANGTLSPAHVAAADFSGAGVVCLCLEVSLETVLAAARAGHDAGATVMLNLSPYGAVPDELLELTDILLLNAHEAADLLGADHQGDWIAAGAHFAERGLPKVLVTLGGEGSVVLDSTSAEPVTKIDPLKVSPIDTTGAGDAFTVAVAAQLASGASLVAAARFASVAAAIATTRKGAQASYPDAAEVAAELNR
ncbi:ribokinase [Renibacterium salmoninarum ATCC 33209]|uniref:Ribokinase n=1 Tax=Renibacterium salmoninarum (strain ATCC 33209 / DSM 20767 / JCM 11484 / NBRC 15589 / NCIMB 2235) TaxID=288705 RepID=A9WUQ1_RENSM|nr:ribokinase [Renibacterium salmoninarum]ABY24922.1 ribokinase [Renibacterium salmoninarum ATCC 33209]